MPESDESRITANIELQTGMRVEETMKVTRQIEKFMHDQYPEMEIISTSSGSDDEGGIFSLFSQTGSNIINVMMRLTDPDTAATEPFGRSPVTSGSS